MAFPDVHARFAPELRRGSLHLSTFCQMPDPNVVEVLAKTRLDSFIVDMQHGMFDEAAMHPCDPAGNPNVEAHHSPIATSRAPSSPTRATGPSGSLG